MDQPTAVAWKYVVGLVFPEDLPMVAAGLLAAGYDSPSLRDLAGRSRRADTEEVDQLLRNAMEEFGVVFPGDETAERCLLHHLASELSAGAVSAREVAARVWQGIAVLTERGREFVAVVGPEYCLDYLSSEDLRAGGTLHAAPRKS
jgi:hypothetical protein